MSSLSPGVSAPDSTLPDQARQPSRRLSDRGHDPVVLKNYPFLSQAILQGASPQLRSKREPGSGCPAIGGYSQTLAVPGTSTQRIASPSSDMCVAPAALGATIVTSGPGDARRIALTDFHLLPGDHPERENVLRDCIERLFRYQSSYHQRAQGDLNERFAGCGPLFVLFRQPPLLTQPGKCALHHPATRQDRKALLRGRLDHDLKVKVPARLDPLNERAVIVAVRKDMRQARQR